MILGGLVALALITALVAPYFINWSEYRSAFEREATRILGEKVTVTGNATARLLPFPSVTFENVLVGDPDHPLVVADRFSMDAELAPFLSGEVLIFDMRLVNPTITLDLDERGLPDWPLPENSPVSPAQVTLENARVINAKMVLHDRVAGRDWRLDGFNASVSAESLYGPYRVSGSTRLNDTPLDFRVNTGGLSKDGFSLRTALQLPSAGIEVSTEGRVAEPQTADASPYNGTFTVRPLKAAADSRYVVEGKFAASPRAVDVAEYRAEFGSQDDPYVVTGTAGVTGGAEPRYRVDVKGTQVTLPEDKAATGLSPAAGGGMPSVSDRLALVQSTLAALPFPPIPGSINVDLPAIVAGDTSIREIKLAASPDENGGTASRRRWKVSRFTAQLPGRTTVEADGVLQLPLAKGSEAERQAGFSGNLLVASRQPSGLATWLTGTADEPIRKLANAGFAARVDITPVRQQVDDLEVILGPARLRGSLVRVSDPARRSTLDVKLSGEALDFDALEALSAVFVGKDGAARFADHDLDIALDLKEPDIRGVKLGTLEASIRSRGTKTEIDRLSVTGLYGASVSATASLARKKDGMHADVDATVVAGDGAQLIEGLSQRFPRAGPLAKLAGIAAGDSAAFADTRLDVVGSVVFEKALSGEASLSVSGETGGTKLSITSTANGSVEKPEEAKVILNASFDNPVAEQMFAQAGLSSIPAESAGAMRVEANVDGSLFSGMKTSIEITGEDMVTHLDGVTTTDILSTGFTGQLQVESGDIEPWLLSLGYGLPGMGLGTTTDISASASWRSGKAVLRQIEAVLNGNRVTGDLTVDATGEIPSVRGDLAFEYLDAGELYSVISGDPSAAIFDIDTGGLLQQEFGPPILAGNDIEIGVKAGEVSLPAGNESLRDLTGKLVYRDGGMALRGIEATFGGGTISGLAGAQNNDGLMILNAQIAAKGVSVDALVPPVAPVITGATDLALQLTGSGRSNAALLSSLSGSGVLSTGPLTVTGLNAGGFAPMIARADAIGYEIKAEQMKALADDAFLAGTSVLQAADYPVSVANGTVRIANATARTGAMSLSADAGVNLLTGAISGKARIDFDPGEEAIAGPQPELALAFASNAEGGFDVTRNYEAVTGYLTQRALEKEQARVEALQARLLERQRLRREVQLFKYRKRMRLQSMEEARLRSLEDERTAARAAQAQQSRAAAAEEAARRLSEGGDGRPETGAATGGTGTAGQDLTIPGIIDMDQLDNALNQDTIRRDLQPVQ